MVAWGFGRRHCRANSIQHRCQGAVSCKAPVMRVTNLFMLTIASPLAASRETLSNNRLEVRFEYRQRTLVLTRLMKTEFLHH